MLFSICVAYHIIISAGSIIIKSFIENPNSQQITITDEPSQDPYFKVERGIALGIMIITQTIGVLYIYYTKNIFEVNIVTYFTGILCIKSIISMVITTIICIKLIRSLYRNLRNDKAFIFNHFVQPRFLLGQ